MATALRASTFPILARNWRSLQPSLGSNSINFLMRNASKSSRRSQKKDKNSGSEGISKEHQLLLKKFPNPKGILHNTILSNVKDRSIHDLVAYKTEDVSGTKKGIPVQKKTILVLRWPEEMELEGTGRKKKEAELVAAAQACARLKELGLLDDNNNPLLPDIVVYKKEEIRGFLRKQNQPDIINIEEQVNKELSRFLKNLQDQETMKLEDDDQTNEDLSLYHMLMSEEDIPDRVMDIISDKPYQRLSRSKRDIRNGVLLQRLVNQKHNPVVTEIQKKVQTLPIMDMREEILSIINANQVVVLCGQTGCGKTTQMPQFVLDDWIRQDMGSQCNIVVTQPRRISAIHTAERIALERGEQLGKTVGYQIRLHRKLPENHGCMLVCTTGILLKKLQQNPDLTGISHVIVDEVHERDVNTDFLLVLLKNALERNKNVKLILMSASINPGLFSKYFDDCPMINVPGFMYPVKEYFLPEALADLGIDPNKHKSPLFEAESKNKGKEQSKKSKKNQKAPPTNVDLVVEVIKAIDKKKPPGAILCFLPGWQDIRSVYDKLQEGWGQSKQYEIYPVHSHVTVDNQQAMFDIPPEGVRKVVLATNVAETSITIGDVVYVVNTGNHKEERFDSDLGVSCLDLHWASQANIKQRKGRAGRRQPGECFHLFDQDVYNKMSKFQTAEILRIPLEQIVVQAKIHNETMPAEKFLAQAIEPPPSQAVSSAIDLLQDLAILNGKEELTSLGKKISCFGSDPRIAKAIIYSAIFRCVDPILTIAASLCIRDPFRENLENRKLIMEKMQEFSGDSESDHLMRVAVYQGWEEQKKVGGQSASSYVQSHQLYLPTLQFIRGLRRQFANNLEDSGMVMMSEDCFDSSARCNENSGDEELIKAVICSAFYPNLLKARLGKHEKGKLRTNKLIFKDLDSNNVLLHRKSVNCAKKDLRSKWLTYFSKVRSDVTFVRDCSVIHPMAVVAFAGNTLYMDKLTQKEKKDVMEMDSSISPGHLAKLVIDDEQVPHETAGDGSEFSPWEGLPITFYMTRETALYTMAFMRAMKQMIEECLTNEADFLSGPVLERHSTLLNLFRKLLGTQVLHSHSGPQEE